MQTTQITARVPTQLKTQFTKIAKEYGIPTSTLIKMFMKMIIEKKIIPEFWRYQDDTTWTSELEQLEKETYQEYKDWETMSLEKIMNNHV